MTNDSPLKAVLVTLVVALACSVMVSGAAVYLKPIQLAYQNLDRNRHIVDVAGLAPEGSEPSDEEVVELFRTLEARAVDLAGATFTDDVDPATFDQRKAVGNPEMNAAIPDDANVAGLGTRSRYAVVYIVRDGDGIGRMVLPIHGQGMWSTMYAYLALEADLETVADVKFYEQGETPGLGDQVLNPGWRAGWRGKRVYDDAGQVRLSVSEGTVDPAAAGGSFLVDGLTGATITAGGVTNIVRYWLGEDGFGPFLAAQRDGSGGTL